MWSGRNSLSGKVLVVVDVRGGHFTAGCMSQPRVVLDLGWLDAATLIGMTYPILMDD
jgi:hypothetical protein